MIIVKLVAGQLRSRRSGVEREINMSQASGAALGDMRKGNQMTSTLRYHKLEWLGPSQQ